MLSRFGRKINYISIFESENENNTIILLIEINETKSDICDNFLINTNFIDPIVFHFPLQFVI